MTTNSTPNQSQDTDSSAQEPTMPNNVVNNNEPTDDNQPALDEPMHDNAVLESDTLDDDSSYVDDGDVTDMDDSDLNISESDKAFTRKHLLIAMTVPTLGVAIIGYEYLINISSTGIHIGTLVSVLFVYGLAAFLFAIPYLIHLTTSDKNP